MVLERNQPANQSIITNATCPNSNPSHSKKPPQKGYPKGSPMPCSWTIQPDQGDWSDFNCNNKFMMMWKFQLWIADKETRLQQTVHWWSPWSSRWNAGASPTQAKKEQPRPFPHICHYISFYLIWLNLARQDPNLTNWTNWFLARCSWGAPSWMWGRKPLPRPILLLGPFPLACLRWSSWWALHWQNWAVIKP